MKRKALEGGGWFDCDSSKEFSESTHWNGNNHIYRKQQCRYRYYHCNGRQCQQYYCTYSYTRLCGKHPVCISYPTGYRSKGLRADCKFYN